jgi:hypothetical protein
MKLFKFPIRTFRRRLSSIDSVPQFIILGIASKFLTGLVIITFRLAIEWPLDQLFEDGRKALKPWIQQWPFHCRSPAQYFWSGFCPAVQA